MEIKVGQRKRVEVEAEADKIEGRVYLQAWTKQKKLEIDKKSEKSANSGKINLEAKDRAIRIHI